MTARAPRLTGTPLLYRTPEAAALLAISESTLRRLVTDGDLPALQLGSELRFAHADLVAYVERLRREVAATAAPAPIRRRRSA